MKQTDMEVFNRAATAYFRSLRREGEAIQQPSNDSGRVTHEGLEYVVLRNANGLLAVYRVRPDNGVLKRLKRWPAALETL